jgi:hypothetical protein
MKQALLDDLKFTIAQLRHAYSNLVCGQVSNYKTFANGLIAPSIRSLEEAVRKLEELWP